MIVGWLRLSLRLPGVRSLKEKRHALRGTLDRLGRESLVAIAEVGDHDLWGNAEIGVSVVGNNAAHVESVLQHVIDTFDKGTEWDIAGLDRGLEQT